jgi:hypothetical protein
MRILSRAEFERGFPGVEPALRQIEWVAYLHRCASAELARSGSPRARARAVRVRRVLVRVTRRSAA